MELAQLNEYLDLALNIGINQVDNIQLQVQDQAKYQMQARLAAIEDAQKKAELLAEGFGKKLGAIWQVRYNNHSVSQPLQRGKAMMLN